MTKVLVTGSKGQLGNEIQQLTHLFPQFSFIFTDIEELDITNSNDVSSFLENHQPEFIINTAGYTAVDKAEEEKEQAMLANAFAVKNLVEAASKTNAYFIHISTDYVFDGQHTKPYLEDDVVNPVSVYGETKLQGEKVVVSYKNGIVVRTAWLYSSFGHNFVKTILRLGKEKSELRVVNDQLGSPTYAADLALALLQILDKISTDSKNFVGGIFHYANENTCTWFDFAKKIIAFGDCNCEVKSCTTAEYPTKAKRPVYSVLSKDKIKQTYTIEIPTWENALERCVEILKTKC